MQRERGQYTIHQISTKRCGGGMRYRKALIIKNPLAGRGKGQVVGDAVAGLLDERGIETRHFLVDGDRPTDLAVREALADGCDLVVIVGGDGTLRSALGPLVGGDVPVHLAHAGTGNLIATYWRIPTRPRPLVKLLDEGDTRRMDIALIDGEPFALSAGFGIATDAMRDTDRELKRFLGPIAYLWSLIRNLARSGVQVEMRLDDGRTVLHRAKGVVFANCGETLGQVDIVPDSSVDDGWLDVAVLQFANLWEFLKLVGFAATARWRRTRNAVFYRTRKVEVWIQPPMSVQIDGDVFDARSYFKIELLPGALPLVVPKHKPLLLPKDWLAEAERRLEQLRTGSNQAPAEILRTFWEENVRKFSKHRNGEKSEEKTEAKSKSGDAV